MFPQVSLRNGQDSLERQEHLQIAYALTPSIITTWVAPKQATRQRDFAGISSPLPDSNRRPPPYHRATRREPRARPGSRGQESRARRRNRPKRRSRVPAGARPGVPSVFPSRMVVCSLRREGQISVVFYALPRFQPPLLEQRLALERVVGDRLAGCILVCSVEDDQSAGAVAERACARSAVSRTVSSRACTRTCAPEPTPNVQ